MIESMGIVIGIQSDNCANDVNWYRAYSITKINDKFVVFTNNQDGRITYLIPCEKFEGAMPIMRGEDSTPLFPNIVDAEEMQKYKKVRD